MSNQLTKKEILDLFQNGGTLSQVADYLNDTDIPRTTVNGDRKWCSSTVSALFRKHGLRRYPNVKKKTKQPKSFRATKKKSAVKKDTLAEKYILSISYVCSLENISAKQKMTLIKAFTI